MVGILDIISKLIGLPLTSLPLWADFLLVLGGYTGITYPIYKAEVEGGKND